MPDIPQCPHSPDEPLAWLSCPPCQREAKHGSDVRPTSKMTSDIATLGSTAIAKWNGYCKPGRDRVTKGEEIVLTEEGWAHPSCR